VKDLFWRTGVVDAIAAGTATPEQCGEFWTGQADGQSGGMGACRMAENLGFSLGDILNGDNSICYMKRFPTRANLDAGAITLLGGEFPGGDPTRLFSVPPGAASRVVKVNVSGDHEGSQTVFLRVHGASENTAAGDLYAVDLWFCKGGATADGFERIHIGTDGLLTSEDQEAHSDGSHNFSVTGYVTLTDGTVVYDVTRSRHAQVVSVDAPSGYGFKAEHEVRPDDTLASKSYGTYGGGSQLGYAVASFSGTSVDTLRFLAGAFTQRNSSPGGGPSPDVVGSTEYRSTYYAASPGSALEAQLAAVDIDTDPFYAAPPAVTVDASAYSCSATPDVELALDFANPDGAAVKGQCEQRAYDRMQFCESDPTVQAAQMNIGPACYGPPH
jgi:hypothetical protein